MSLFTSVGWLQALAILASAIIVCALISQHFAQRAEKRVYRAYERRLEGMASEIFRLKRRLDESHPRDASPSARAAQPDNLP